MSAKLSGDFSLRLTATSRNDNIFYSKSIVDDNIFYSDNIVDDSIFPPNVIVDDRTQICNDMREE